AVTSLPTGPPEVSRSKVSTFRLLSRRGLVLSIVFGAVLSVSYWLWYLAFPVQTPSEKFQRDYEQAYAELRAGRTETAMAAFRKMTADSANTTGFGYDGLAALFFEKGRLREAQEAINKALTANTINPMALLIQGDIAFSMGDREEAKKAYLQATQVKSAPA